MQAKKSGASCSGESTVAEDTIQRTLKRASVSADFQKLVSLGASEKKMEYWLRQIASSQKLSPSTLQ